MPLGQIEEMGPVDYVVLEWPGRQPAGEAAPLIVELVERGIIRILDVALMAKDEDGSVRTLDLGALDDDGFAEFEGASVGPARRRGPRGGRQGPQPGHVRRRARLGEPLGGARRDRHAALRRSARRQRPHPHPGHRRLARGAEATT